MFDDRQRRTFTPAFKREAASLVLDQGYSCPEAARSLDVGESLLRRWVAQLQLEREGVTPTAKAATTVSYRRRLRKKNSILCPGIVDHYNGTKNQRKSYQHHSAPASQESI
nr:transposase [Pseudomonas protegens]